MNDNLPATLWSLQVLPGIPGSTCRSPPSASSSPTGPWSPANRFRRPASSVGCTGAAAPPQPRAYASWRRKAYWAGYAGSATTRQAISSLRS